MQPPGRADQADQGGHQGREEAHIATKTSRLHALQHAAHPDAKAIERLQACIRRIEEELAKDREDLIGDEEDFRVKCSGHTHA